MSKKNKCNSYNPKHNSKCKDKNCMNDCHDSFNEKDNDKKELDIEEIKEEE